MTESSGYALRRRRAEGEEQGRPRTQHGPKRSPSEGTMIFEFDADAFLTDRRSALEGAINEAHGDLLARAREVNRDCHELLFAADIRNRDMQGLLVATLFMRALEHYQATIILLGTGMIAPAKVALRATLECVFMTRRVAANEEELKAFIADDLRQRRNLINKAQQHNHVNLEELRKAITSELIESLEQQIEMYGPKRLKVEDLSKLAGMHDWYTTYYYILSKAAHTTVRELESYLSLDEAGHIRSLNYAPSTEEIPHLILAAAHCILLAASAVDQMFDIGFGEKGDGHIRFIEAGFRSLNEDHP
jgi:hypothetical protein